MHFWEIPGRLLLVFAVGVHGVAIRPCCDACVGLALASVTMWVMSPSLWDTIPPPWAAQFLQPSVPSKQLGVPAASWAPAAAETPESWEFLTPSRLGQTHQPWRWQNSLGDRTPELQLLSQNTSVISFFTPKGRAFVTSWVANKQVQVPGAVSCPRALSVTGVWFSTKCSSGGFAQGGAEKEIQNKEQAHIQSTALQL